MGEQVRAVSAGGHHALAVVGDDGRLYEWGGGTVKTPQPVADSSGTPVRGVRAVASGGDCNLALKDSGEVYLWNTGQPFPANFLPELKGQTVVSL